MLGGGNEGSGEKKSRERKVYSRRSFKGLENREQQKDQAIVSEGTNLTKRLHGSGVDVRMDKFWGQGRDDLGLRGRFMRLESMVRINLSMKSKSDALELRRKLESERDMVRSLMRKLESIKEGQKNGARGFDNGDGEKTADGVGPPRVSKLSNQSTMSVYDNTKKGNDNVGKEKRTLKASKLYRNTDFLLAKDNIPPAEINKKLKSNGKKGGGRGSEVGVGKFPNQVFKSCCAVLEKLMKHKHGWVFNKPVDPVALGLHDYFEIIKNPMDLGTVKDRLKKNWYKSPTEFAEDVRLTLRNALSYNPKGQDVYVMAEQLLTMFEDKWAPIEADYTRRPKHIADFDAASPTPMSQKAPPQSRAQPDMKTLLNNAQSGKVPKKPKVKDPNKREMTYDEKQKLSINLQSLPSEKLENVVQIIKKRNPSLTQQDDEIEVDIDSVDTETLWELDRFISNHRKSMNKNNRKAKIVNQLTAGQENHTNEKVATSVVTEAPRENRADEKVVSPPVEVLEPEHNDTNQGASQSNSSCDPRSSSSDSDGENSSANGSEEGQLPKN